MRLRIRIEDRDAETARRVGRKDQRKLRIEEVTQPEGAPQPAILNKGHHAAAVWCQCLIERAREPSGAGIDNAYAVTLQLCDRRKRPHLPQPLAGAEWKVDPGRIGAIDYI